MAEKKRKRFAPEKGAKRPEKRVKISVDPAALSRLLSHVAEDEESPTCQGSPPVWADMRQSLNSALPWHKGYQSGDYTKNNVLLGCLLDGFPEERDIIDPSGVIIMNM